MNSVNLNLIKTKFATDPRISIPSAISSPIPLSQKWLISVMIQLGYQSDPKGVCFGVACAAIQAALVGEIRQFYERLQLISNIPVEQFRTYIDNLINERLALIKQSKNDAIRAFEELSHDEKQAFENKNAQLIQEELNAIKITNFISEKKAKEILEKAKKELLYHVYAQPFIAEALEKLPEDKKIQFEILPFFDNVELFQQNTDIYPEIFSDGKSKMQDLEYTSSMTLSRKLEQQGGITQVGAFSGIYNIDDLKTYFSCLEKAIKSSNLNQPFSLLLLNDGHGISINFNPLNDNKWTIADANNLEWLNEKSIKNLNADRLPEYVLKGLLSDKVSTFTTMVYGTTSNKDILTKFFQQCQQDDDWKQLHQITPEKLKRQDSLHNSWLYLALMAGELNTAKELIDNGADVNAATTRGYTPLYMAVHEGYYDIVKALLDKGADANIVYPYGQSPLYMAAHNGYFDIVEVLLKIKGINVNVAASGGTPLSIAAHNGDLKIVKALLAKGAKINAGFDSGVTPLMAAAINGHLDIVKALLLEGANVNATNAYLQSALILAAKNGHLEIVNALLDKGADINEGNGFDRTPLINAVVKGHINIVKALLDRGANVEPSSFLHLASTAADKGHFDIIQVLLAKRANIKIESLLFLAAQKGKSEIVYILLANGANINAMTSSLETSLYAAAKNGHSETVKVLLDKGANVNAAEKSGATPLSIAVQKGHLNVVKTLLTAADIDVNAVYDDMTPLYIAAQNGHLEIVKVLLSMSADVNAPQDSGATPLSIAIKNGHLDVVKVLLAAEDIDVDAACYSGATPLLVAIQNGHLDIVKALLDKGADVNAADYDDMTPLIMAIQTRNLDIVKILLSDKNIDISHEIVSTVESLNELAVKYHIETAMVALIHQKLIVGQSQIKLTLSELAGVMGYNEIQELITQKIQSGANSQTCKGKKRKLEDNENIDGNNAESNKRRKGNTMENTMDVEKEIVNHNQQLNYYKNKNQQLFLFGSTQLQSEEMILDEYVLLHW